MRSWTIAFLFGSLAVQQYSVLPPPWQAWALLGLAALLLAGSARWHGLLPAAGLAAGVGWSCLFGGALLIAQLPMALEGEDLVVEGVVHSMPKSAGTSKRFDFQVESMRHGGEPVPGVRRIRLSWYECPVSLRAGERWRFTVRLKRPRGMVNPAGFDYEAYLFRQGTGASGYVRQSGHNRRLEAAGQRRYFEQGRQQLREDILAALGERPATGIVLALAIGDRDYLSGDHWRVLAATGTSHLVAISGLHVGLVAGLVFFLAARLWARCSRCALRLPAPKAAALLALAAAAAYAGLAGFAIPTQRALIMVSVAMVSVLLQTSPRPGHTLALAAFLVLLRDPLAVLAPGFWLSFGAVAVILMGMSGRLNPRGPWWRWGRVQWLVFLGLAPLTALFFQQVSLVAPLANLIAVPWLGALGVPLVLLGVSLLELTGSVWLLQAAAWMIEPLLQLLSILGQWMPQATLSVVASWTLVPAAAGLIWLLAPRGWPSRWLGAVWLMPLLLLRQPVPEEGEVWLTLLDVGQGLAAAVQTRQHMLLYDAGPRLSPRFDTGEAVVVPFLRWQGIRKLDTLIISHGDNDHMGGARSVLAAIPAARVLTGSPEAMRWTRHEPCRHGQTWVWDGVVFEILRAAPRGPASGNDGSCVLKVTGEYGSVLVPGDIETGAEAALLGDAPGKLRSSVIVAPHHGSKTSSTEAFVAAVRPELVLFSVGYRNRYHFPHASVTARYRRYGGDMLDTAGSGAITVRLGSAGVTAERYRDSRRRYWQGAGQ